MKSVFGLSTAKPIEMAILLALSVIIGITLSWTNAYSAPKPKLPTVSKANWNSRKLVLTVKGRNWGGGQSLILNDAITGEILGTTQVDLRGKWQMAVSNPAEVPCRVRASAGGQSALRDVKKAPVACGSATSSLATFAFNDLGMHCYDSDFSVFAILPPFNVLRAQVVRKGSGGTMPEILDSLRAGVSYAAFLDANGSINTTSAGKTNFWDFVSFLFGASLPVDEGLLGAKMPGAGNIPQAFALYDPAAKWFIVPGIPITNRDDQGQFNPYPLMRIEASDLVNTALPSLAFAVLPVSDEMNCSDCHATGGDAAAAATQARYGIAGWSGNTNPDLQYRENALILHDAKKGTALMSNRPILCASCHYSPALDLAGTGQTGEQIGKPFFSFAMHGRHGKTLNGSLPGLDPAVIPDTGVSTCYLCHPGQATKCLRGAMGAVGLICQDCHGGLLAVGSVFGPRTPWLDEPKCQSCHSGDAVNPGGDFRLRLAYAPDDLSATPLLAANKRFAEETGKLYRNSVGHSGIACEACHGSPHAEWPVADPNENDNLAAIHLQGHTGPIIECRTCHGDGPPLTTNGPHGLHNINDPGWNQEHHDFFDGDPAACKACHGDLLQGTVLSRAAANRVLVNERGRSVTVLKGAQISCSLCHENPLNGDH